MADKFINSINQTRMPPRLPTRSACAKCLLQRRGLSSTASLRQKQSDLPPPPPESGHVRLTNRALISLTGVDSTAFLQGLISQNVVTPKNRASPTTPFYAGFLNAQGRLLHDTFIYPTFAPEGSNGADTGSELGYLVELDKAQVSNLMKHFKKHKLRSKLKLRALEEGEKDIWAVWDNTGNWEAKDSGDVLREVLTCVDNRVPDFGHRLLLDEGSLQSSLELFPGQEASLSTYHLRRILHGVPEGQDELVRESALPMDSNMDIMGGIDFHKGCYLGQELTIRTHHRGVVRKRYPIIIPTSRGSEYNEIQRVWEGKKCWQIHFRNRECRAGLVSIGSYDGHFTDGRVVSI
ncbi:predicted protein [Uncinocarpus reesii 1704]|uniref:Iron-sulfur cluster assembly factor IBA57 homolog, mitochondrial n=1 Tax=Uncinocarpus reesii (strain UAMH 1704) TaxID=336963 RepID=C4JV23_UNCRE|nr:uncharacterized protein UREG_04976 [Uncinocarpus reesii 1704]EEP80134.1 predicted protein [Uncinocarpus reesii 1704]